MTLDVCALVLIRSSSRRSRRRSPSWETEAAKPEAPVEAEAEAPVESTDL